jgi:hypothetical protein
MDPCEGDGHQFQAAQVFVHAPVKAAGSLGDFRGEARQREGCELRLS